MPCFMTCRRFLLLLVLGWAALPHSASAQAYFNHRHALEPRGYVGAMAVMPTDSGYVTVGFGTTGPPYDVQILTASFDTQGQVRRYRLFSHRAGVGLSPCQSGPLTALPDGGCFMAATVSLTSTTSNGQLWLFTAAGDTLWTRTYSPANSGGYIVLNQQGYMPADSGFAVVGTERLSATQADLLLLRTDKTGRERWRRTYRQAGQGYHVGTHVLATPDAGFLLTGYSALNSGGSTPFNGDWLVIKTDSLGQEQWRYTLATPYNETAQPAVCLPGGGYLVAGSYGERFILFGNTESRPLLVRLDGQGHEIWRRTYGAAAYGTGVGNLHLLADGSALLAGQTLAPQPLPNTVEVIGFAVKACAATGDSVWYRTYRNLYGRNSRNYLRDFTPTPDGGFVGTGFLHPFAPDTGPQPIWLFKTDRDGYMEAGGTPPPTVACPLLGMAAEEKVARAGVDVWPNPAPASAPVHLTGAPAHQPLTVLDVTGRRVATLPTDASGAATLPPSALVPGVYVVRAADGRSRRLLVE